VDLPIVACEGSRLAQLYEFRARVWTDEGADPLAFPGGSWSDDRDASRLHWVALDGDRIVGAASLGLCTSLAEMEEPEAYAALPTPPRGTIAAPARVVVDAAYRGRGLADALLDRQDAAAREAGAVIALRQASPAMVRILERRGWCSHGPGPADPRFPGVVFTVMSLAFDGARR
jgi:GNAT superfamily N-acetyltransferase